MLKEFIEHIQKTAHPIIHEINGANFAISADGGVYESACLTTCSLIGSEYLQAEDSKEVLPLFCQSGG